MDKKKLLKNQHRKERRGAYERSRKKRNRHLKLTAQKRFKKVVKTTKKTSVSSKGNILIKIRMFFRRLMKKIKCLIGLHRWTLMSGLEGTPKYMCAWCMKLSKELWQKKK